MNDERLTPKVPTTWGDGYYDGEEVLEYFECPNCKEEFEYDRQGWYKYCPYCGQAFDWSFLEEDGQVSTD